MPKVSTRNIVPNSRLRSVLRLVDRCPLPAHLILQASETFGAADDPDDGFTNVRRVREKMQHLVEAALAAVQEYTIANHGTMKFYRLAPEGYRMLYQHDPPESHRKFFRPVARLNWEHAYANAKVIVKSLVSARRSGVRVLNFCREKELKLRVGSHYVEPDHFFLFDAAGRSFNHLFEIDCNTETLDGVSPKAWRKRIIAYEAYQDQLLANWKRSGEPGPPPRLRVSFLTTSIEHAYNFLSLAGELASNPDRLLFYATTLDTYLNDNNPLLSPILLDHHGGWNSLVDLHPTSRYLREPVRLPQQIVASPMAF